MFKLNCKFSLNIIKVILQKSANQAFFVLLKKSIEINKT